MQFHEALNLAIKDGMKIRGKDWGEYATIYWNGRHFMCNTGLIYTASLNECMMQDWEVVQNKSLVRLLPAGRRFKLEEAVGVFTKIHGHPTYNAVTSAGQAVKIDDERYVINVE